MNKSWYQGRAIRVLTHAVVWAIALSLPYLLDSHRGMAHHHDDGLDQTFFYLNFITNLLWIGPFYLNVYLLTPRLFYRRRYITYAAALALVFGVMLLIHSCMFNYLFTLPHFSLKGATGFMLPAFILTNAIGTTFRLVRDKMQADQLAQEKQEENLKTELSFLRSQINPHFIFNILNNLVARHDIFEGAILDLVSVTWLVEIDLKTQKKSTDQLGAAITNILSSTFQSIAPAIIADIDTHFTTAINAFAS